MASGGPSSGEVPPSFSHHDHYAPLGGPAFFDGPSPQYDDDTTSTGKRPDTIWSWLFAFATLLELIFGVYCSIAVPYAQGHSGTLDMWLPLAMASTVFCTSTFASAVIFLVMKTSPRAWIYAAYGMAFAAVVAAVVFAVIARNMSAIFLSAIMLLFLALNFAIVRRRIGYTTFLVKSSGRIIKSCSGLYVAVFVNLIAIIFLSTYAACSSVITFMHFTGKKALVFYILHFIYFRWAVGIANGVLAITTGGVVGKVCLNGLTGQHGQPTAIRNPTMLSARSAITNSFGSACMGGFFIAFVELLNMLVSSLCNESDNGFNAFMQSCFRSIMSMIEWIVKFVSRVAFVRVGIYGESFLTSVKRTCRMFLRTEGLDLLLVNNVVDTMIWFGMLIAAAVGAASLIPFVPSHLSSSGKVFIYFSGAVMGAAVADCLLGLLRHCVTAFIVCTVKEPEVMIESYPGYLAAVYDVSPKAGVALESSCARRNASSEKMPYR